MGVEIVRRWTRSSGYDEFRSFVFSDLGEYDEHDMTRTYRVDADICIRGMTSHLLRDVAITRDGDRITIDDTSTFTFAGTPVTFHDVTVFVPRACDAP